MEVIFIVLDEEKQYTLEYHLDEAIREKLRGRGYDRSGHAVSSCVIDGKSVTYTYTFYYDEIENIKNIAYKGLDS